MKPTLLKLSVNGQEIQATAGQTLLEVFRTSGIDVPVMCAFDGLSDVGACRLCVVEMEGTQKLFPACTTPVQEGQKIQTHTEKLQKYRRMITELFLSERKHICAVCVANNKCELQDLAVKENVSHVRFPYLEQDFPVDASHEEFIIDQNRCILCTRCVRVCDEVEGAHTWDVMNRGVRSRVIADFNQPWGESDTCTSCGKCVQVCPTGALWPKDATSGRLEKHPERVSDLVDRRKKS